jgi:hypothetical protein
MRAFKVEIEITYETGVKEEIFKTFETLLDYEEYYFKNLCNKNMKWISSEIVDAEEIGDVVFNINSHERENTVEFRSLEFQENDCYYNVTNSVYVRDNKRVYLRLSIPEKILESKANIIYADSLLREMIPREILHKWAEEQKLNHY